MLWDIEKVSEGVAYLFTHAKRTERKFTDPNVINII